MRHICICNHLTIIGSDNGLSPGQRQAILWTNAALLLIGLLGTNLNEILIKIYTFSLKEIHLKMSSGKCLPFCLSLNVLKKQGLHGKSERKTVESTSIHKSLYVVNVTTSYVTQKYIDLLSIPPLRTNLKEIGIKIRTFSSKIWKSHLQNSSHFVLATMS